MSEFSHIMVDWDETCFEHYAFLGWLEKYAAETGDVDPCLLGTIDQYHDQKGENMRLYRHRDHIADILGLSWERLSGDVERAVYDHNLDFCYPEVHEFWDWALGQGADVRVLTYGDGEYQRFKLGTCQYLAGLRVPVHVVQEPKGEFLAREFGDAGVSGLLVDDKHPLYLPDNWQHARVDREEHDAAGTVLADGAAVVNNLTGVVQVRSQIPAR